MAILKTKAMTHPRDVILAVRINYKSGVRHIRDVSSGYDNVTSATSKKYDNMFYVFEKQRTQKTHIER